MADDIQRVNAVVDDADNLELLFTLLELTRASPGSAKGIPPALAAAWDILKRGYNGWPNPWDDFRSELIGLISQAFLYYQYNLNNFLFPGDLLCRAAEAELKKAGQSLPPLPANIQALDKAKVNTTLDAWSKRFKKGDAIISFNWDLLHETALYRAGKWRWSEGYGFLASNAAKRPRSPVMLYKLHGSVNWLQETADALIEITDPEQLFDRIPPGVGRTGLNPEPDRGRKSLIVPSLLKTPSGRAGLLKVWFQAADILVEATEVVAVGYSFASGADTIAFYLSVSSLARNRYKPTVIVVDPGDEGIKTWQRLCEEAGLAKPQHDKRRFEDWLLTA